MKNKVDTKMTLKKQSGIASILVVVFVGVAMIAATIGLVHTIRGSQVKSIGVQSVTNAQTGVWAGAEAFRAYLDTLDADSVDNAMVNKKFSLGFDPKYGNITAKITSVDTSATNKRVGVEVFNDHTTYGSTSKLGLVYEFVEPPTPAPTNVYSDFVFERNLLADGAIQLHLNPGEALDLSVRGDFSAEEISLSGPNGSIGTLAVTGNVTWGNGSGNRVERIHSNGYVEITDSAYAGNVESRDYILVDAASTIRTGRANNYIDMSGVFVTIDTRGHVLLKGGQAFWDPSSSTNLTRSIRAGTYVSVTGGAGSEVAKIEAGGAYTEGLVGQNEVYIDINQTQAYFGELISMGRIDCGGWPGTIPQADAFDAIYANSLVDCPDGYNTPAAPQIVSVPDTTTNPVQLMQEVAEVVVPDVLVNVWDFKDMANYVVSWEPCGYVDGFACLGSYGGRIAVAVKNIQGIPDGDYYLGSDGTFGSAICADTTIAGTCVGSRLGIFCRGTTATNACLTYVEDGDGKKWFKHFDSLESYPSTAPGYVWIDGNFDIRKGEHYNTFLVNGDVIAGDTLDIQSVNYAGDSLCNLSGPFAGMEPSNVCITPFNALAIGNTAIAAGGFEFDGDPYIGGNIDLGTGGTTAIYGAVLAGNMLGASGATTVYGYMMAGAEQVEGLNDLNTLDNGTITVNLTTNPNNYYQADLLPNIIKVPESPGGGEGATNGVEILWAKYL